jgi:methionyl-tRNA formyltransferase
MSGARRVLFLGSKQLGLRVLQAMQASSPGALVGVLTIDDRADRRSVHAGFVALCTSAGIPLAIAADKRHAEELIVQQQPDLCVVVGWYWLISGRTLESVPLGFVGIHNSRLPSYRGGSPLVWQMINGEPSAGYSIFQLTAGMDDGPVWAQGSVPIERTDYVADVLHKLEAASLHTFEGVYPRLLGGGDRPRAQAADGESYCAQRVEADGLIDWSRPAHEIYDFVRAQSEPYPGGFTFLGGNKLTVWRAEVFHKPVFGAAGQIARITPQGVLVACRRGTALMLLDVELGGTRGPAATLVRSVKDRLGNR